MDLGNELKQLVDDGIFDWMNESIAHNPSALPRHCIDTNGGFAQGFGSTGAASVS